MRRSLLGLSLAIFIGGLGYAQDVSGSIQGLCESTDGKPEADVRVLLSGPHLQGPREIWTDRLGEFRFLGVPPGVYELRADRVGLQPVEIREIVVELGRRKILATLTMTPQPIVMEPVVVREPEILIDPVHAAAGGTLDERDYATLPVDRDYKSLISILPLANASYRGDPVNVGGSTGLENQYYIDGVNVTRIGTADGGTSLPYNFVRAVEVQTAGYEAQYGRALGAVVNAVTYSGTNDFELQAFGFIEASRLTMEPRETAGVTDEGAGVSHDLGLRVGGPLLKDRLWYSAAVNPRFTQVDKNISGFGTFTDSTTALRYAGKLTWQATRTTNLELSVFGDPSESDGVGTLPAGVTTALNPDPLLYRGEWGGTVASLRATVVLSRTFLLETSVGRKWERSSSLPATDRGASEIFFIDQVEGVIGGGAGGGGEEDLERTSLTAKATVIMPRHMLVAGVDYQDAKADRALTGGVVARLLDDYWVRNLQMSEATVHNRSPALYLQDNWRISNRFTLSPGLRWSAQYLVGTSGRTAQRIADEWQPRMGFSWLLGTESRQRLFGSYGRFYQTIPTAIAGIYYGDYRYVLEAYSTDPRDPGSVPYAVLDGGWTEADRVELPNLQAENFDEFTLGYEQLLGAQSKLTFRAMRRDLRSSFQTGYNASEGGFFIGTPGQGDFSFLPPPEREYTALEVSAEGTWGRARYRASYVLSRAWGNYPGLYDSDFGNANPGGGPSTFGLPEQAQNSTGFLPNDRTSVLKLSGDYPTRFGLSVGAVLLLESGSPINDWAPGSLAGTLTPIFVSPRGSAGRTPSLWDVSLRLTYNIPIARQRPLQLLLDLLHVGNPQGAVWVDEVHYLSVDENGNPATINPNYKQPVAYQPPMALRVGLLATF